MKGCFKRYQGWCDRCDRSYVANGKRCCACGVKQYAQSKSKKPNINEILKQE
jgi:hypothetical protein